MWARGSQGILSALFWVFVQGGGGGCGGEGGDDGGGAGWFFHETSIAISNLSKAKYSPSCGELDGINLRIN